MVWLFRIVYFICPLLAIGSLVWYFVGDVGDVGVWALLLFFVFGFTGMFVGGTVKSLEERRRNTFTFRAGDSVSIARAALFEIEAKNEIPELHRLKDDVLELLDDRQKTTAQCTGLLEPLIRPLPGQHLQDEQRYRE